MNEMTSPRRAGATPRRPIVLCVLDGWGHRDHPTKDNAILGARTPNLDRMTKTSLLSFLEIFFSQPSSTDASLGAILCTVSKFSAKATFFPVFGFGKSPGDGEIVPGGTAKSLR